ncbi:MAG TPA: large conductance mechanosensitive channel protein MscL [Candidatus Paceibacterota bacterium]|nr:large conductance mechanosensitive channel protein MscL [Candidatus Paceibacterota bacterium]
MRIKQKIKECASEFKAFAIKGNAIELAVGIVIGTAFNNIVNSLVNDVIMQAIAMAFGKPDFSSFVVGAIKIGNFINAVVNFLIVSLSVFVTITLMNKLIRRKKAEEAVAEQR